MRRGGYARGNGRDNGRYGCGGDRHGTKNAAGQKLRNGIRRRRAVDSARTITSLFISCSPHASFGTFHLAGARTAVAAYGVAIIALLAVRTLGFPIPATRSKLALGGAAAITARVGAIVALLAEDAVDLSVAAISAQLAAGCTSGHTREAVRREVHAVIAFFGRSLLKFVPTTRPGRTIGIAMPVRPVIDAIVARFVARDDSITALADALALYRNKPSERQVEVRSGAMTFRMEKRNFVDFAHGQTERRSHGGIDGKRSRNGRVKSPKIKRQAAIDEDPDIVIA